MENKNDVGELRSILFDTARRLMDKENPIEIERAKAVCEVGEVIISCARVEVAYAKTVNARSLFIESQVGALPAPALPAENE